MTEIEIRPGQVWRRVKGYGPSRFRVVSVGAKRAVCYPLPGGLPFTKRVSAFRAYELEAET
ncbi:MAG: hypothetical protein CMH36_10005 [Microbacterium sp.]|mgnify:CR=1 FL=1|uniref:Uncharacterized protein n=1 Tax=Microbacterium ginsengisoli TaxID=400772 RepID=A0A3C1KH54_9MICO|nr:hypothetical protein [Microbacterium sp.]MCK9917237.1 hypothetical protein [Microbacteriaceae bacterium K1510]HAN25823.1 hypothetical protein [Microbacterium ginsengisoli]|tara:strand:- start:2548 stop:2730 length:183 start_codon:yes stop_codon:yes gene_type:complete